MMKRSKRFGLRLNQAEREGLTRLAEIEGLSEAATLSAHIFGMCE